jgi:hypothetical protein
MEKFESNPNPKKPLEATQLDINFEDTSKGPRVEKEEEVLVKEDNNLKIVDREDDKDNPSDEYTRYRDIKEEKRKEKKKEKTQQEKDDARRQAILKALKKRTDNRTGYEHYDPLDPNL